MKPTVAVVIGRFQIPELHDGHRLLIETAKSQTDALLIIMSQGEALPSSKDPLDIATRLQMLQAAYPSATCAVTNNNPSDALWSKGVDELIAHHFPGYTPILFGSRDSFLPHYHGQHETQMIEEVAITSATAVRSQIGPIDSPDFRAGMVYAQQIRPALSYQAVDIAIINLDTGMVVLGQKENDLEWRFPGGFVDPTDSSLESAAYREMKEELGHVGIHPPFRYLGSFRIDDWRYRGCPDQIMSAFFVVEYMFGPIRASDDLARAKWHPIDQLDQILIPDHKPLGLALQRHWHQTKEASHA